jgi:hypothetical protein
MDPKICMLLIGPSHLGFAINQKFWKLYLFLEGFLDLNAMNFQPYDLQNKVKNNSIKSTIFHLQTASNHLGNPRKKDTEQPR